MLSLEDLPWSWCLFSAVKPQLRHILSVCAQCSEPRLSEVVPYNTCNTCKHMQTHKTQKHMQAHVTWHQMQTHSNTCNAATHKCYQKHTSPFCALFWINILVCLETFTVANLLVTLISHMIPQRITVQSEKLWLEYAPLTQSDNPTENHHSVWEAMVRVCPHSVR